MALAVGGRTGAVALVLVLVGLRLGIGEWQIGVGSRYRSGGEKSHETYQCIVLEQRVVVCRHTVADEQELKPCRDTGLVEADPDGFHGLPSRSLVAEWATQCRYGGVDTSAH